MTSRRDSRCQGACESDEETLNAPSVKDMEILETALYVPAEGIILLKESNSNIVPSLAPTWVLSPLTQPLPSLAQGFPPLCFMLCPFYFHNHPNLHPDNNNPNFDYHTSPKIYAVFVL